MAEPSSSAGGAGNHPQAAPGAEMVVTHRDGDTPAAAPPPSKSALKKAAREKEKAEKAAKREEEQRKQKEAAAANDSAKDLYGRFEGGLVPESERGSPVELVDLTEDLAGKRVSVEGRVSNARVQSAKLAFLDLREEMENIQAVIAEGVDAGKGTVSRSMVKWCGGLSRETIVYVTALVVKPDVPVNSASLSTIELHVEKCFVIADAPLQLVMQVRDAMVPPPAGDDAAVAEAQEKAEAEDGTPIVALNTRLNNRVLDLRTPLNMAIFEINGRIKQLFREFMHANGFREFETPKVLGAATEGGASVFEVKYFDKVAYLGQSPQFYKQMLIGAGRKRVYEIGPVFRAENSNTARHLTEFTGLDFEMRITSSWTEVLDMAEKMILYIFSRLPRQCKREMEVIQKAYPEAGNFKLPAAADKVPRITFAEGVKMLREAGYEASETEDISTSNEKALGKLILQKHGSDFYTMTHYPSGARPFYTHLDPADPSKTNSYDAFMRGQEIVSGAQRNHDPAVLARRMRGMDPPLDPESEGFKYYVSAFRDGCAPHGGAGFGLNRLTMLYLGLPNVRQATLFPRDPTRLVP